MIHYFMRQPLSGGCRQREAAVFMMGNAASFLFLRSSSLFSTPRSITSVLPTDLSEPSRCACFLVYPIADFMERGLSTGLAF